MKIQAIYISSTVRKQQGQLDRSGKKGVLALSRFHQLLKRFVLGDFYCPEILIKRTKHGEQRVRNCYKYDLGSGFRLVTIRDKKNLFITFLGSHDVVDLWLENNMGYTPKISNNEYEAPIFIEQSQSTKGDKKRGGCHDVLETDIYEAELLQKIDDSVLKHVFSGLFATQEL